jgi:hypothetical protein
MSYGPQDVIARIQTIARGLPGVIEAPEYAPESANQFPFAVSYYETGETTLMAGWRKGLHTVACNIYVARQMLPTALKQAMPFYERFMAAIEDDPTLGGTVSTIVSPVKHSFGWINYGGQNNVLLGWRFQVTVKQET